MAAAIAQAQRLVRLSTDPAKQHAAPEAAQALLRQLHRLTRLAAPLLQLARIASGAALKHGGGKTTVTVRVSGRRLQVLDDGPGVAPHRVAGLVRNRGFCASIHFDAKPEAAAATPRRRQRP